MVLDVVPVPAPRMTQRDRWDPRPCVKRYYDFKNEVALKARRHDIKLSESGNVIIFFMPMAKSWSKKKKERMAYTPHQQRPDLDNLTKAFWDALEVEDKHIWTATQAKIWAPTGGILLCNLPRSKE